MSAQYNSTAPTLPDKARTVLQTDASGNLKTVSAGSGSTATQVHGNVASGAADSGNPVKTGGVFNTTLPTLTNGQRGDAQMDNKARLYAKMVGIATAAGDGYDTSALTFVDNGTGSGQMLATFSWVYNGATADALRGDKNGQVVQPALSTTFWQYAAAAGGIVSSTADVPLKAAGAAGVRNYLSAMTINHDTLSAVTECVVKDGATVIWRGKLQTAATDVANGAGTIKFDPPLRGTAATALNFALLSSVTGGVFVNAQGYTGS